MLKELECLEIFTEVKVAEEETVYQKLARIRKKFLTLQKIYLEFTEGENTASNVSQEGLELIKSCVDMLNKMQNEDMINIENEILKNTMINLKNN
ncbi:MAG: hypothetical protein ACRCX2_27075 [Paraclostridium sp.]